MNVNQAKFQKKFDSRTISRELPERVKTFRLKLQANYHGYKEHVKKQILPQPLALFYKYTRGSHRRDFIAILC